MTIEPTDLFTDKYLIVYDPRTKNMEVRRKSTRAGGNLTLLQTMELIDRLLRRYQTTFRVNRISKNLIWFPFAFIQPKEGDQILNERTDEVYTVDQLVTNPTTKKWEGLIRMDLKDAPSEEDRHVLSFLDQRNYVVFDHTFRTEAVNSIAAKDNREGSDAPPIRPTIGWHLVRKEPGGLSQPFGTRKELKPRQREVLKDPLQQGYTVSVRGQTFDNIVQFDAFGQDSLSVESLIEWFEQFMRLYSWVLQKNGVEQTFFWRRVEDETTSRWRQPLYTRGAQYYFRTEQLEVVYERDMLRYDVVLDVSDNISRADGKRYIAGQLVSGELTTSGYRGLFYDLSGNYLFGDITIQH
ncbi:MAG: hypothetical protein D6698_06740 [Gammaproteobacteria bacterium]|nr:MAG: hypothetical protein D6698_06740 [Gammaproteobacteria bacterium]